MYGFQPKSARGKTVQQLADGGMVHSIKGMMGLRPKTREELLAADAKAQARNQEAAGRVAERTAQQPQPAPATPAPATPAPPAAISDYSGMNAMQRREKEQGLKNGGMVKPHGFKAGGMILGPGTGTSDSIETEKRPGTFIMPADSTQAIGPEALEELGEEAESMERQGGEAVPVRLSNGEFEFTPEEVQALGEAVLTVMRDATHERADGQQKAMPKAAGFAPAQVFADGGTVAPRRMDIGQWAQDMEQWRGGQAIADARQAKAFQDQADADEYARQQAEASKLRDQQQAGGAQPQLGFADGGMVENDITRVGNSYSGGNVGGSVSINGQAGAGTMSTVPAPVASAPATAAAPAASVPTPAAPATPATTTAAPAAAPAAPMGWAERNAQRSTQVTASSIMDSPERRAAQAKLSPTPAVGGIQPATTAMDATKPMPFGAQPTSPFGFKPRGYADGGTVQDEEKQRLANQAAMYARGAPAPAAPSEYSRQMSAVGGALADGAAWLGKTIVSAPGYGFNRPSAAPAVQSAAGGGRGSINPAPVAPGKPAYTTTAPAADASPPEASAPAAGPAPLSSGATTPQNDAAAQALSATPAAPAGFQPAGVQTPVVRNSTNDWAARKALENMATAASSITNRPEWQSGSTTIAGSTRGPKGEGDPEGKVAAYKAALASDFALQQAQPGLDQTAMRENAGITREGMQQDGATTRTSMQEQGSNAREAGRNALAQGEFGLKREAAGFQTRAAVQQEQLRNVLLDPNASPEQRKIAQRSLAALSGKTAADRMQTVTLPDTTNEMGQVVRGGQALVRVLEDGTVQQVPIGAQAPAPIAAPKAGEVRNGYRFKGGNPNDQANWTKV